MLKVNIEPGFKRKTTCVTSFFFFGITSFLITPLDYLGHAVLGFSRKKGIIVNLRGIQIAPSRKTAIVEGRH